AERRREVATLLVLGYTPAEVGRLFLREGLLVHMAGTLLGLPPGHTVYHGLIAEVQDTGLFCLAPVDPTAGFVWALPLSLLFALASHAVVQRLINRMDWLEALNVRE